MTNGKMSRQKEKWRYAVRVKGKTVAYTTTMREAREEAARVKGRVVSLIQPSLRGSVPRGNPKHSSERLSGNPVILAPECGMIRVFFNPKGSKGPAIAQAVKPFVSGKEVNGECRIWPEAKIAFEKALAKIRGVKVESLSAKVASEILPKVSKAKSSNDYWRKANANSR